MDKIFFDLTGENSIEKHFEIPPLEKLAGGVPNIETEKIRMSIGTKPIVFNLKEFYDKTDRVIPKDIQIFMSYNVYVINHTVGIIQEGGWEKIKQIGYQMEFSPDDQIQVLDVLPQSKYIKVIGGNLSFEADLNLNGELSIPDSLTTLLSEVKGIGVGGNLKVATNNSVLGRFNFSVITPEIQSVGKGSDYSEWVFNRADKPLFGDDIEMFQIILVDRFLDEITFKARIYSVISTWNFLPSRRQSDWVTITCKL